MIAWDTAAKVAKGLISTFPKEDKVALERMSDSLSDFGSQALDLVENVSGLTLLDKTISVRCTTRSEWVDSNVLSMASLMEPMLNKFAPKLPGGLSTISANAGAVQFGLLFGWMSKRVLGQYDAALFANVNPDENTTVPIYMVGSNILDLEAKFGFPRAQFERWVLLHELTHKVQFESVSWMNSYYRLLISSLIDGVNLGPSDLFGAIVRVAEDIRAGRNPLAEAGLAGIFVSEEQRKSLSKIGGLMSVLEGHADFVMARAARGIIEEADHFEEVLHDRRESPNFVSKIVSQLYGLDAKVKQYAAGRSFLEAIDDAAGRDGIKTLFMASQNMPTLDEISRPDRWMERVLTPLVKS